MAKRKRTNNDLQNISQNTKDQATRTELKSEVNAGAPEGQAVSGPLVDSLSLKDISVFNPTFNTFSATLWLFVTTDLSTFMSLTFNYIKLYAVYLARGGVKLSTLVVPGTSCINR